MVCLLQKEYTYQEFSIVLGLEVTFANGGRELGGTWKLEDHENIPRAISYDR